MDNVYRIAARIQNAIADADILSINHGHGVIGCGDTSADRPAGAAYGEVMIVVGEDLREVSVGVVWRDDEGNATDHTDTGFDPDDVDGIVDEVTRLTA